MLRLPSSLLTLVVALTAALLPGAAVFAQTPTGGEAVCLSVTSDAVTQAVQASSLVAVARVQEVEPGVRVLLKPEALLKGSFAGLTVEIAYPSREPTNGCKLATFVSGSRVFVFLAGREGHVYWPSDYQAFVLADGRAVQQADTGWKLVTEAGLISLVRGITGQYVVPVAGGEHGAGIDWRNTVLPLSAALLIVFGIGLVLMRVWHRIDPT